MVVYPFDMVYSPDNPFGVNPRFNKSSLDVIL